MMAAYLLQSAAYLILALVHSWLQAAAYACSWYPSIDHISSKSYNTRGI